MCQTPLKIPCRYSHMDGTLRLHGSLRHDESNDSMLQKDNLYSRRLESSHTGCTADLHASGTCTLQGAWVNIA